LQLVTTFQGSWQMRAVRNSLYGARPWSLFSAGIALDSTTAHRAKAAACGTSVHACAMWLLERDLHFLGPRQARYLRLVQMNCIS